MKYISLFSFKRLRRTSHFSFLCIFPNTCKRYMHPNIYPKYPTNSKPSKDAPITSDQRTLKPSSWAGNASCASASTSLDTSSWLSSSLKSNSSQQLGLTRQQCLLLHSGLATPTASPAKKAALYTLWRLYSSKSTRRFFMRNALLTTASDVMKDYKRCLTMSVHSNYHAQWLLFWSRLLSSTLHSVSENAFRSFIH